ncbi:hypothetical protein GIB67_011580 [Kingdonia uniflora]|uniref:RanBP2-type domain-containing protein n=1 Tax=Kingdonia uniflora TaxID=39325 RepID=A0A7J7NLX9_9MAGN|nr:hypothetical protein GIB67_011580 [Kingdonia uniflora]
MRTLKWIQIMDFVSQLKPGTTHAKPIKITSFSNLSSSRHLPHLPLYPNPYKTLIPKSISMSWSCSKCTYLNPLSQKSTCQICLSPPSPSPSPSPSSSSQLTSKWPCKACTFANPFGETRCQICGTRAMSSIVDLDPIGLDDDLDSSIGSVFFPLKACGNNKMVNQESTSADEGLGMGVGGFRDLGKSRVVKSASGSEVLSSSLGSGFRPLQPCNKNKRKYEETTTCSKEGVGGFCDLGKFCDVKASRSSDILMDDMTSDSGSSTLKIMSYNVWFREDLEICTRMKAVGDLIQQYSPDLICFQEVTPNIYMLFQKSSWWNLYRCSLSNQMVNAKMGYFCMQLSKVPVKFFSCKPFNNSIMGRELCLTEIEVGSGKSLVVATSHLESPCPAPPKWNQMYSKERVAQAKEVITLLKDSQNVIFGGDMNWDDKSDGQFPLSDSWVDAWVELRPRENGFTYDTKSNSMLSGNRTLQKRLDRFLCNLPDFRIIGIDMIGMDAIPGLSYCKEKKVKNEVKNLVLPVLPSDHYGLLLTISSK